MRVNAKNAHPKTETSERVKFLYLTGQLVREQVFLAELAEALMSGRKVAVCKADGSTVSINAEEGNADAMSAAINS